MHKQLEDYLNEVAKGLGSLPTARREEELSEIRQHLLSAVAASEEAGQTEDEAVQAAAEQFGTPQAVSKQIVSAWRHEAWKQGMRTQPELILFAVFSLAITLSEQWLTYAGPKLWREAVYPYIGGSLATPYMFSIYFTWQAIFAPGVYPKARHGPIMALLIYAVSGLYMYLWTIQHPIPYNPYFPTAYYPYSTANSWQPMWTVALPLAWAAVLGLCPIIRQRRARQAVPLQ